MRPFSFRFSCIFASLALLCACGPRDARYSPKGLHIAGSVWPPEIVGADKHSSGVFPVNATQDSTVLCCWLAPQADFRVRKDRHARYLRVTLYVPDVATFRGHPQAIAITFPGFPARSGTRALKIGFNTLKIPIPPAMRNANGPREVALISRSSYRPLGQAGPTYGVLMTSIYFE